jgi:hypothetical protein
MLGKYSKDSVNNDFFGWGIVARLDDNLGVKIE